MTTWMPSGVNVGDDGWLVSIGSWVESVTSHAWWCRFRRVRALL